MTNTTFTTSDLIGLEDVEKKRGTVSFQSEHETLRLEMEEIKPVAKKAKEPPQTIIRERNRKHRKESLF